MTSCSEKAQKVLILYYSQTGVTKTVATELQAQTGADICSFDVVQPYDGTFDETIQRCLGEQQRGFVPPLAPLGCDLSQYDVVFLGYPIWFGTYATPVKALLETEDFAGKTVVPFSTFGSGGLQPSVADLREALPAALVKNGYGVREARLYAIQDELNRFLIENGWKAGEIKPLPDYSEETPVTEDEAAVFHAACDSYQFPLGVPVTCGSRQTDSSTDYVFTARNVNEDGTASVSKIYVTVISGRSPEFTQVVR